MKDVLYNPGNEEIKEMENKNDGDVSSLPSRKITHPKPKSFFEKPLFTFLLFLLFVALLITLFLYFYTKGSNHSLPFFSSSSLSIQKEGTPPFLPGAYPSIPLSPKGSISMDIPL
ncbi:hypothetical protein [Thermicanus aegyptius]|uniref:hypothetical protein n=1 Tax=Thermicanus aegyptius TaxID=94009 RepID=UPI00041361C8|nr:hypothetical protein [Thermicanus aegyptius]